MIVGVGGLSLVASWMAAAPQLNASFEYKSSTKIFDANGKLYQELESIESRLPVKIDDIPEMVQLCFISMEDQRFYDHFGVDVRGTAKAIIMALMTGKTEGPGGSTITQQLIKLTHLSSEKQLKRKVQEWKLAYQLEQRISKRKILEAYLNEANFSQTWGIQSAANLFFGKDIKDVTLAQAAVLTAIVNLPNVYNPYAYETDDEGNRIISRVVDGDGKLVRLNYNEENMKRAILVLDKMLELGNATEREHAAAVAELENNEIALTLPKSVDTYSYFTDALYKAVVEDMAENYGISEDLAATELLRGGYVIHSTIDPDIQAALDKEAQRSANFPSQTYTARTVSRLITKYSGVETNLIPQVGGAIIENSTGHVVAMIGGRGEKKGNLELNRALRKFQTGSTTKPITVYAPGLDTGAFTLSSAFDNVETDFTRDGYPGFVPTNSPNVFTGMTSVRAAIAGSINIVAVKAWLRIGYETSIEYGEKFGFEFIKMGRSTDSGPGALALGGYTKGQTPLALASAYSTFPNGGYRIEPSYYTSVTSADGERVLLSKESKKIDVISPEAAYLTTSALRDVVRGGTTDVGVSGQQVGGKTGTTNSSRAVLFAGFTKEYTGAFWFGYDYSVYRSPESGYEYNLYINTSSGYYRSPAYFWERVFRRFYDEKDLPSAKLPSRPEGVDMIHGEYYIRDSYGR
jgi:penicillin-binding protein 1A